MAQELGADALGADALVADALEGWTTAEAGGLEAYPAHRWGSAAVQGSAPANTTAPIR